MKNIHVLSTDKPSRLIKSKINDIIVLEPINVTNNTRYWEYLNIYITSDEEIKEGDWVTNGLTIMIANLDGQPTMDDYHPWKKIILTTDQDLIKDGVQEIDDEFLKWFVKNPSCEEVGIEPLMAGFVDDEPSYYENMYDIIIPKEEPKQETLEEASETAWNLYEHVEGNLYSTSFKNGFKLGAEWLQDKKMYSEEDMDNYAEYCINHFAKSQIGQPYLSAKEWFEQFKKK
jgi:hypothetical protein